MANERNLFTPLKIKTIEFKNRIWVSPMCQYSSQEGHPTDWHFVHLGSRAVGGAGLVMVEATAVSPEGRISPDDSGIWSDEHIKSFKRITDFVREQGAISGIQLAHAGRKASTAVPWLGSGVLPEAEGGWQSLAPSPVPFNEGDPAPREMSREDIAKVIADFEKATERSLKAGFQLIELHMAHGYLMHEFLSPLANLRNDQYGGSLENRMRLPLEVVRAVRKKWPEELPLFVRISATDWADGPDELKAIAENRESGTRSWNLAQSVILCRKLKEAGVDLIDCSSGGMTAAAKIPMGPGYQTPFAETIRREAGIMTAAVGMITEPVQAEAILHQQQADAVFLARELLRNPYWPVHAANVLGVKIQKPNQYGRS
jgi:2,4-dienoyl-CoA reductase-like NADH-dependent reductase (Old Yellow Enzyme family)